MPLHVIQWTTGRVGTHAVAGALGHPDLELVGAWVHSPDKEGHDVGELCGLRTTGIVATRDKDALLALDADCVCYTATEEQGPQATVDELARILRAGKNVVNITWPALVHPGGTDQTMYDQLHEACLTGGTSLYTAGIDPGFGSFGLALSALSLAGEVRSVRMYEIMSYASWESPYNYLETVYGFGQPDVSKCFVLSPGYTSTVWGSTVRLVAQGLGVALDEVVEAHEVIYADEAFEVAKLHIAEGTISGMRFEIRGMVGGEAVVVVDHVTKLRDEDFPEVSFRGGGYRVEIDGEPRLRLDLELESDNGDHVHAAYVAMANSLVNAIPAVCAADPGVLTFLDLPPHPSKR